MRCERRAKRCGSTAPRGDDGFLFPRANPQLDCGYDSAFSRHEMPELCFISSPSLEKEGAGKAGRRLAPAVRCAQDTQKNCTAAYRAAETSRPSLRSGLTAYVVLSPGSEALSPSARRSPIRGSGWTTRIMTSLDAQTRAPGPHDFAVRRSHRSYARGLRSRLPCKALRADVTHAHRRPARVVTIAIRPSSMGRVARHIRHFRISVKWNIFGLMD